MADADGPSYLPATAVETVVTIVESVASGGHSVRGWEAAAHWVAKVRAMGQEENTLIFYIGDNGGPTNGTTSQNGPLREGELERARRWGAELAAAMAEQLVPA